MQLCIYRWGCTHEKDGVQSYISSATRNHDGLQVLEAGLFVDIERPYLGASPDGIINCNCCGKGVLEVKCPFCIKEGLPGDLDQTNFCMTKQDDLWTLKRNHAYYYQIQLQLEVCKLSYCDFVVWTEKDFAVERIDADKQFFNSVLDSVQHFFVYGILPEIVGKWYTRKPITNSDGVVPILTSTNSTSEQQDTDESEDMSKLWCYCNEPSFGEMIQCNNAKCTIKWFHFECLRIRCPPKGKWYCPSCCKLSQFCKKK